MDLGIGGYGINTLLPAMPLIVERERLFVGLMGLGVNNSLLYPNYFAMIPTGPDPSAALTESRTDRGEHRLHATRFVRHMLPGGEEDLIRRRRLLPDGFHVDGPSPGCRSGYGFVKGKVREHSSGEHVEESVLACDDAGLGLKEEFLGADADVTDL